MYVTNEQGPAYPPLPLAGRTIAVTRAREQSQGITDRLRDLGAEVVESPAISIAPLDDYSMLDRAIQFLSTYDWVIFTSVNGVQAFLARLKALGLPAGILRSKKLGAIGPATSSALQDAGCPPTFVPDAYVAEAVVEQIGDVQGSHVLLPRADIARKALADGLRGKGAEVDEVTAYKTVPGEGSTRLVELLRSGGIDAITFTSSSTVRYTIENLTAAGLDEQAATSLLNKARIVCIGPITAATAQGYGLQVAKVAVAYTTEGLVKALVDLFGPGAQMGEQDAGDK